MTPKLILLLVVLASLMSLLYAVEVETTPPFVHQLYVPQIENPRTLVVDSAGHIIVGTRRTGNITAIRETNHGNGTSTVETATVFIGEDLGLNHGIAIHNGFFYAASPSTVYRWSYTPGQFSLLDNSTIEVVVVDIPSNTTSHNTRTITFDDTGSLYVQCGSGRNFDETSYRARIRRFDLGQQSLPIQFDDGEIFADGLRNTIGIGFSSHGTLFGVNNGPDPMERPDLGEEIWPSNPAEELNKFSIPGTHFGYPYCWTSYNITGYPRGTQFVAFDFQGDGTHTDEWCRNVNNNALPVLLFTQADRDMLGYYAHNFFLDSISANNGAGVLIKNTFESKPRLTLVGMGIQWMSIKCDMKIDSGATYLRTVDIRNECKQTPPHSAPLSISFYTGTNCGVNGGFPCGSIGDAFVAFHGAGLDLGGVNYGYSVSWYPFNKELDLPTGEVLDVIFSPNPPPVCTTCFRAVSAVFNKDGHLIITSDATNEIYRVAYNWTLPTVTNVYYDRPPNSARSFYSNNLLSFVLFMIFARILHVSA